MFKVWKKIYYGESSEQGYGPNAYVTMSSMQLGYLILNDDPSGDTSYYFQVRKNEIAKLIEALQELEKIL